jgi:hypothetical protein
MIEKINLVQDIFLSENTKTLKKINEIIDNVNDLLKVKENKKLYVCPYDIVVGCTMEKGCKDCEDFVGKIYDYKELFEI